MSQAATRRYNGPYTGENLDRIAFPLGGIGAGMICLEGTGALSHVSIKNFPDIYHEPCTFSAICIKNGGANQDSSQGENIARVLEGPVPNWKLFGGPDTGNGAPGKTYGLPRFRSARFSARFPFATIQLTDPLVPLEVAITGWSPFVPGNADDSSLPVAALEYRFSNPTDQTIEAVYSFNTRNFVATRSGGAHVTASDQGFVLRQPGTDEKPWDEAAFCVETDDPDAAADCAWFRGGWWDPLTMAWKKVAEGDSTPRPPFAEGDPSPGGSLFVPFTLAPGEEKTVTIRLSWYAPNSNLRTGPDDADCAPEDGCCSPETPSTYKPWYSGQFASIEDVTRTFRDQYTDLRQRTSAFTDAFYDTTLPDEVVEAVAANLSILKSPTVLRQTDGRLWAWEGCHDRSGCCAGSCTHVWNYAQAIPHLFPDLERSLRHTEYHDSQDDRGHQNFRAVLPIRSAPHDFHSAADGQLGGIMKVYREWRISGDTDWLSRIWPKVKESMDYAITTWDPDHTGMLVEPHHNTYDIEFWGPNGMCTSFYLGALKAITLIGDALDQDVSIYQSILEKGVQAMETDLWNGEYFYQKVIWEGLRAGNPTEVQTFHQSFPPEALQLLQEEGPKYQYGTGCISDGVLGAWIAAVSGIPAFLDREKVRSHLRSIHKYNLVRDLSTHANCQRPTYAAGDEGGLLLCTWPRGGKPSLPFVYSDEVWTGIEYQVASHLMLEGMVDEGLEIVRTARDRYDGRVRNPFDEYECGHWYARAMSSYAMVASLSGARYDAVEKTLYMSPKIAGDFRSFLSTEKGIATVGVQDGKPFVEIRQGTIDIENTVYVPYDHE